MTRNGAASRPLPALLALTALACAVYAQTYGHGFILLDDPSYVVDNGQVRAGLCARGFAWAFTTFATGNWHPLTWLSHMADVSLFGTSPGGHHLVNVALHAANTLLLFAVLSSMTGSPGRSLFVAAVFALHPLHVESVAWIAERKDLLCAFFFLSALRCYRAYAARPGKRRYFPVALMFVLALLSKPMAVTLPFVLLLLDWWPLGRLPSAPGASRPAPFLRAALPLVAEKVPLLLMSAASCLVTFAAQSRGGNVVAPGLIPLWARAANAVRSLGLYLLKAAWPGSLAVFYPHPRTAIDPVEVLAAAFALSLLTALAVREVRRRPWLAAGWLWYLGTLVPVIGLVQIGSQALADRYMYLPLVGLPVMAAWSVPEPDRGTRPRGARVAGASALVVVALLAIATWRQAGRWRDPVSLFSHAMEVTGGDWNVRQLLGSELARQGRIDEAVVELETVLRTHPGAGGTHRVLGWIFLENGPIDRAERHFREAARLLPWQADPHVGLGMAAFRQARPDDALAEFRRALDIDPGRADARYHLGLILDERGDLDGATAQYREALRLRPGWPDVLASLAVALDRRGDHAQAVLLLEDALRIAPDYVPAHALLAQILPSVGREKEALDHLDAAARLAPDDPQLSSLVAARRRRDR